MKRFQILFRLLQAEFFYSVSLKEFCIKIIKIYGNEYMLYFTILFFFLELYGCLEPTSKRKPRLVW